MAVKEKYRDIVKTATMAAGAIGVPGAFSFGLDVTAMTGIWGTMIVSISRKSDHEVDSIFATKLTAGVLTGVAAYVTGSKIAMGILHALPIVGTLTAIGVNSVLNALFTYKVGHAVSNLFDKGDFDVNDAKSAAKTLLVLVACLPSLDEVSDLLSMVMDA